MPWEGNEPGDPLGREQCGLGLAPLAQLGVLVAGPPGGGSRLSHRSCPKAFSGKNTFSNPVTPGGPLQLLTILFSICKSFPVGSCHPESDSVDGWAEPEQAGARLPPSSSPARLPTLRGASNLTGHLSAAREAGHGLLPTYLSELSEGWTF